MQYRTARRLCNFKKIGLNNVTCKIFIFVQPQILWSGRLLLLWTYSRYNSTFYYYRYLLASSTCCTIIDTICCYQALRWRHQRTIGSSLVGKYLVESKTRTSVQPGMEYPLLRISVCHNSSKHKCLQLRAATVVLAGLGRDERAATELT